MAEGTDMLIIVNNEWKVAPLPFVWPFVLCGRRRLLLNNGTGQIEYQTNPVFLTCSFMLSQKFLELCGASVPIFRAAIICLSGAVNAGQLEIPEI